MCVYVTCMHNVGMRVYILHVDTYTFMCVCVCARARMCAFVYVCMYIRMHEFIWLNHTASLTVL